MTLKVVIADDEPPARARLRRLLGAHADIEITAECADGTAAVNAIETTNPDLVLLDVQMPELDGFGVLQALESERWPAVIFVTAYDQYAVRAFEVHALDYVLKPVEAERLNAALDHARRQLTRAARNTVDRRMLDLLRDITSERRPRQRVPVRVDGRLRLIDWADVDWIGAAGNYVTLHVGSREYLLRDTIARLDQAIDPGRFVRIHRSTIVQFDRIADLAPAFHGDFAVRLKDGTALTLSRTFRPRIEQLLGRKL